ncbi:hypothetical protein ABBQ32_005406 [Trebouxia sp. C0010 RCD-2024]
MGPRGPVGRFAPCPRSCVIANTCVRAPTRGARDKRNAACWLNSPVASNHVIDRPPANKPKLSYVGNRVSASTTAAMDGMCIDKASWQSNVDDKVSAPQLTKEDSAFEAENCQFVWGTQDLTVSDLNALFQKVGFPQRDPNRLQLALDHSHSVLWIRSMKQSRWARQGQLLGFARATSDGALSATIWDVAVYPAWQRSGLGRGLIERLTARLVAEDITIISLYAEPNVVALYNRLGFVASPEGIQGMAFQKSSKPGRALLEQATTATNTAVAA